jgi:hypothetical protein
MTIKPDLESNSTTHNPTRKDLIFAPPIFFGFNANVQMAHLVLPDTRANASQNQKSQFYSNAPSGQIIFPKNKIPNCHISNTYFGII